MITYFGLIILIVMIITIIGNPMLTVMLKLLRMIFIFFQFLKLSFFVFQCNERDYRYLLSFYNLLVSLANMSHFLIIMIGNKNFLDFSKHFIYAFDQNLWFSLYESESPSYFICYNTINPTDIV